MPQSTTKNCEMNLKKQDATSKCTKNIETTKFGAEPPLEVSVIAARPDQVLGLSKNCVCLQLDTATCLVCKANLTRFLRWLQTTTCPPFMTLRDPKTSKTESIAQNRTLMVEKRQETHLGRILWLLREILLPFTARSNQILELVCFKSSFKMRLWSKLLRNQILFWKLSLNNSQDWKEMKKLSLTFSTKTAFMSSNKVLTLRQKKQPRKVLPNKITHRRCHRKSRRIWLICKAK